MDGPPSAGGRSVMGFVPDDPAAPQELKDWFAARWPDEHASAGKS